MHEFAQDHSREYAVEYLKYWTGNGAIKLDDFSYCPSDYLNKINFRIMSRMKQLEIFSLNFSCSLIKIRPAGGGVGELGNYQKTSCTAKVENKYHAQQVKGEATQDKGENILAQTQDGKN